jgi:hypothetical protein
MGDGEPQIAEVPARRVKERRPRVLHPCVDAGRARLVHHHRDAEFLRLGEHREGEHRIRRRPVLVHRVELETR